MLLWKEHLVQHGDMKLWYLLSLSDLSDTNISVTNHKALFPRYSKRSTDTYVLDLLLGHSLQFGSFKFALKKRSHPNCLMCGTEDNNFHQLMYCPRFNCSYREALEELCDTPDSEIGVFLHIILSASHQQVDCFRKIAQIIFGSSDQ